MRNRKTICKILFRATNETADDWAQTEQVASKLSEGGKIR